jgi:hypothetical protein
MLTLLLITAMLITAIITLTVNNFKLKRQIADKQQSWGSLIEKVRRIQVQMMDRMLSGSEGSDPDIWLDKLKETLNQNPNEASELKETAFPALDVPHGLLFPASLREEANDETFLLFCNPVNNGKHPTEMFRVQFLGNQCVDIKRSACSPW